jgi:hypothetical protein
MNVRFFDLLSIAFFTAQHHSTTIMLNIPIWTHLSNHIKLNQFSLGKAEPGSVRSTVEIMNQLMAGRYRGLKVCSFIPAMIRH